MGIKNYEVLDFIKDEIKNIQAIKDFCDINFNKPNITLFIGADERMPPEQLEYYPAIVICPLPKDIGDANVQSDYSFMTTVLIAGKDKPIMDGNVITYDGIYQVEKLSSLILDYLVTAFDTKTNVESLDIKYISAPVVQFPIYEADIVIKFSIGHTIGSDCSLLR